MQKNGAGLHTASSCFWDNQTDGSCAPPSASLSPGAFLLRFVLAGVVFARPFFEGGAMSGLWL